MKKILLFILAISMLCSSCSFMDITLFSKSSKNFDEKVERVAAYLKTQNCKLIEHSDYYNTEKNLYDLGNEQLIIDCNRQKERFETPHYASIDNGVHLGANIMTNQLNKGSIYITVEAAIPKRDENGIHILDMCKNIREFTMTYDDKPFIFTTKENCNTFLYANQTVIYSDMDIIKEIANAKEIKLESRSTAAIKATRTLHNNDLKSFKRMIGIIEKVHSIINS